MKLRISPLISDIIICVYVAVSLFFRFKLEAKYAVGVVESLVMGACFVLILWVLIKLKVLNPNWFGLLGSKKNKT